MEACDGVRRMDPKQRTGIGSMLAVFGGVGITLVMILGGAASSWVLAAVVGLAIAAGAGVVLAVAGLRDLRR